MKAVRLLETGDFGKLAIVQEPQRQPGPDEIQVKVRACSLNHRDLFLVRGVLPGGQGRIPLSDCAGDVIAIGSQVTELAVGDRVMSTFYPFWLGGRLTASTRRDAPGTQLDGYAREYVTAPATSFTPAPAGCTYAQAAALTCTGVTAWRALVARGGVKPGETVLVLGSGSVSVFALQLAKAAGARVIATSSSEEKLGRLKRLGADETINYAATPEWGRKAKELAGGHGVDHVVEVGGPATLAQSISACKVGGHVALVGVLTGFTTELLIPDIFANEITMTGISIGSRADQQDLVRAIDATGIAPVVDRSFNLDDVSQAFRHYDSRGNFGKVCLEVS
jgi:NADPH:quinone reductase-like Zn-dependent oxidoreductase